MMKAEDYLKKEMKDQFNVRQLVNGLDPLYQGVLINVLEDFAKSQPKWISVEDRLPNENTLVQTYGNPNDGGLHICNCWYSGNDIWRFQHGNNRENKHLITHWMELPPPPQTKEV